MSAQVFLRNPYFYSQSTNAACENAHVGDGERNYNFFPLAKNQKVAIAADAVEKCGKVLLERLKLIRDNFCHAKGKQIIHSNARSGRDPNANRSPKENIKFCESNGGTLSWRSGVRVRGNRRTKF